MDDEATEISEWQSEEGNQLLSNLLSTSQLEAFYTTHPASREVRAGAERDVEREAESLRRYGGYQRARQLEVAFEQLKSNAVEPDDYEMKEEESEMSGNLPMPRAHRPSPRA